LLVFISLFLITPAFMADVWAWSNGGYSADPSNPDYGTHDWIAHHALDWLPDQEKQYILDNLATYLYGTELPDNSQAPDGIGDTAKHHVYFNSAGVMTDDAAAVRASTEYGNTLGFLKSKDFASAAKYAGIMSHYIVDMAVFSHVMGAGTDWGAEKHHSDYEDYVNQRTSSYEAEFNSYLAFDGSLDIMTAYEAAKNLAYDTTFDMDGDLTCIWMDQNYDWNNQSFRDRCRESLNLAVNYLTDVLHTLHLGAIESTTLNSVVINEVELNPPGNDNSLDVEEWVELYNPMSKSVDISGWMLSTTHGETVSVSIPQGTVIGADSYYVYGRGAQWLDNDDESIILDDASGREIDRTPKMSDADNDGRSWQRYPNGKDTDTAADWSFRTSTKGASNGGVLKSPSSITCSVLPSSMTLNNPVTVSGSISPPHANVAVMLTYIKPDGGKVTRNANSAVDGSYKDVYKPDQSGSWSVKASWVGDKDHEGAESSFVSFIVELVVVDTTPPVADAGPDQTVNEDTLVTFDGSNSYDNVGIKSYKWTFMDAGTVQTLTGIKPTYTFTTPGSYTVILNVSDTTGNWAVDEVKITVLDITKPTANAGSDRTVNEDTTVTLDGSASSDNVGITAYTWTFTDVTTKTLTGGKSTYTFNTPGVYTITLNVTDSTGNWATDTIVITVADVTKPVANAGQDKTVNVGTTVSFDAGGSTDNVGIVSYEWDFGDGTTGTGVTTTHTYTKPGTYTVTLTLRDAAGNSAKDMMTVTVQEVAVPAPIPWWTIGVIVAVVGAVALAALRLLRHKT